MDKHTNSASYMFRPYRSYLLLGVLGFVFAVVFCAAGISWLPQKEINSNAVTTLLISGGFAIMTVYSTLGYRACVVVEPGKITILNDGNRRHSEKSLDLFSAIYFVKGRKAYQYMVLTMATDDPVTIRKIAYRNISGLLLHVGEHIVIPVWPKDVEMIEAIVSETIQIVHI